MIKIQPKSPLTFLTLLGTFLFLCTGTPFANSDSGRSVRQKHSAAQSIPASVSPNALGTAWELFQSVEIRTIEQLQAAGQVNWQPVILPYNSSWYGDAPVFWYRTTLKLEQQPENIHTVLCFGGVKFDAKVWLGNRYVGGYTGGGEPFEIDLTDAINQTDTYQLIVRVEGVQAIVSEKPGERTKGKTEADRYNNTVMWPVGSQGFSSIGIWEPVRLEIRDTVHLSDLFIKTSVANKTIAVEGTVHNLTPENHQLTLSMSVVPLGGDEPVLTFTEETLDLSALKNADFSVKKAWGDPRLWTLRDPFLYYLIITLSDETGRKLLVAKKERFGFREFTTKDDMLYLNGVPMHALGTASHPHDAIVNGDSKEPAQDLYRQLRETNINFLRLHANLWPAGWVETADEVGMPLILETAFFCRVRAYALKDPVFWENFNAHAKALQKKFRNNPSFCMFSLCNEILHCGGTNIYPETETRLAEAGVAAKKFDSTRPILYDGDLDPAIVPGQPGVADVVNPHYPMDFSGRLKEGADTNWPDDAWWIDRGKILACYPHSFWMWDRKKPLYFGEFLHIQHYTDTEPYSLVTGDDADGETFNQVMGKAKAKTWSMQIPAYRAAGVSGLCPWVITEPGPAPVVNGYDNPRWQVVKDSYEPVTFVLRPTDRFCPIDKNKALELWLFNDTDVTRDLTVSVEIKQKNKMVWNQTLETQRLTPAERKKINVELDLARIVPDTSRDSVSSVTEFLVEIKLVHKDAGIEQVDRDLTGKILDPEQDSYFKKEGTILRSIPFAMDFSQKHLSAETIKRLGKKIGYVGNVSPVMKRFFKELGTEPAISLINSINDYAVLENLDTLIIGRNMLATLFPTEKSFTIAMGNRPEENLYRFLNKGGKVIVLEQKTYPHGLFPVQLRELTISHPENNCWTKRWSCLKPFVLTSASARFNAFHRLGGSTGFVNAAVLHWDNLFLSQLPLETSGNENPAVYLDFMTALEQSCQQVPATSVQIADTTGAMKNVFKSLDVPVIDVTKTTSDNSKQSTSTVNAAKVITFVNAQTEKYRKPNPNETIILCGLNRENVASWSDVLPKDLFLSQLDNRTLIDTFNSNTNQKDNDKIFQLYSGPKTFLKWYGSRKDLASYRDMTPLQRVADFAVHPYTPDRDKATDYSPIGFRQFETSHQKYRYLSDCLSSSVQITLTAKVELPVGSGFLEIDAHGTTLWDEGSMIRVFIDQKSMGTIELEDRFSRQLIPITVEKSPCDLKIEYVNDEWDPVTKVDRNFWFRSARYIPSRKISSQFETSTTPSVSARVGEQLIIDNVKWYQQEFPTERAFLYLAELLRANGVAFSPMTTNLKINGSEFEHDAKKYRSYGPDPGILAVGSNGEIKRTVQFGTSGKYRFVLRASGTPAEKVYPHFTFLIDKKKAGEYQLLTGQRSDYELVIDVTAGEHQLSLRFDNDLYIPSNDPNVPNVDRNSVVESMTIEPVTTP